MDSFSRIAESIEKIKAHILKPAESSFLYDILATIPSALLAAVAAIAAAWATVYFQNKSVKENISAAIDMEIEAVVKELQRAIDTDPNNTAIRCDLAKLRSSGVPVFSGNSHSVSMLEKQIASEIFEFYTAFLTIPLYESERNLFVKKDIEIVIKIGKDHLGE